MSNKISFAEAKKNRSKKLEEQPKQYTDSEIVDIMNGNDAEKVSELSTEQLKTILSQLQLNDNDGRNLVFLSEDEAMIYAVQLQRNIPEIRFVEIIPCYSMYLGKFYMIRPNTTVYSKEKMTKPEDFMSANDFCVASELILQAIVEYSKRLKEEADKEKEEVSNTEE
jgi:hypothetical protein